MISAESLQVWFARVEAGRLDDATRASLAADLDVATVARLDRFRRPEDRDRGLAAHALLRRLLVSQLAPHLDAKPRDLALGTLCQACGSREHGKPYLDGWGDAPPAQFNLSHSGELVAVAIAGPQLQVGVDVERRARRVDWAALRRSIFDDAEWEATGGADDPGRARTDLWARKEAAVKATGYGLATPLRQVLVDSTPGSLTASQSLGDVPPSIPRWHARIDAAHGRADVTGWDVAQAGGLAEHYAAALAVRVTGSGPPAGTAPLITTLSSGSGMI